MNLGTYLDEAARLHGGRPLLRFCHETISYVDFARRVNRLASALRGLGLGRRDLVHVLAENSPDVLAAYFAIQKVNAVAGPINNRWKAAEVEYLLNDSQGRALIVEEQFLPLLDEIRQHCPHLQTVIQIGGQAREGHHALDALIAGGSDALVRCDAADDEIAYIFYTSGTTGSPKGVLLSHGNVLADVDGITRALAFDPAMTILIFLPLFHVNAMLTCMFSIGLGFTIVLRKGFSASEFWQVVDRYRVNCWSAVPAVYQILLSDPGRQRFDLSSLKFGICGAAPLAAETMRRFEETFGIPIVEGYGLTEATCVSTINPRDGVRKVGSIGLPIPGQEVKILDQQGDECPVDQRGEICIRGPVVMQGYHNRPEETAETIDRAGWLHTGDVAFRDADGYIFIVDRIKDMVIRGGENIYPKEIDNLLATHPKIAEAATIGVPDETMGEEIKAFVVARDASLTEQEVIDHCKAHLAEFKVPRHVEILAEDFPRNALGKVLKKVLKQWGTAPRPSAAKTEATAEHHLGTMKVEGNMSPMIKPPRLFGKHVPPQAGGAAEPQQELIVLKQLLAIPQRFTTGPLMGKFLKELRDHQRILGNRCPECRRIQTPPREVCAVCHVAAEELVEIGPEGRVISYDVTFYASPDPLTGETRETPCCPAFLILDGCGDSDVFWHEINPEHIPRVRLGARVRPVWAERRSGAITDIEHFDIID